MRNEMIGAVVRRAIEHPEFREKLMENPREALDSHGFALEHKEMMEIERVRAEVSGSPDDVEQRLVSIAERYGVDPEPK
ncbi:MAG TPA: hypothetical protein VGF40_01315 [Thermoanaerobaculia bacterium]